MDAIHWLLSVVLIALLTSETASESDRAKLKDLTALTFYRDKITIRRRTSPTNQVRCIGGTAACAVVPEVVRCNNDGFDGRTIQWRCTAKLDKAYTLQQSNVKCEGYDGPGDDDILVGSCYVEVTIDKTGYRNRNTIPGSTYNRGVHHDYAPKKFGFGFWNIIFLVVILIVVFVIVKACISNRHRFTGGGGGVATGPTTFVSGGAPPQPGFNPAYGGAQPYGAAPYAQPYVQPVVTGGGGSSGPGFLTGAAAGAATGGLLGYMFGRTGHSDHHHHYGDGGYYGGGGPPVYSSDGGGGGMFDSAGTALSGDVVESSGFGDTTVE